MAENGEQPLYFVNLVDEGARRRSIPLLIASRQCYQDRQGEDEADIAGSDPKKYVKQIVKHCSKTPDYLLPDTPLKEAIFRAILAGGNEPRSAEDISEDLTERWSMTAQTRDISSQVIQRLLDNSPNYSIDRLPVPEEEEVEEEEEEQVQQEADEGSLELEAPTEEAEPENTDSSADE